VVSSAGKESLPLGQERGSIPRELLERGTRLVFKSGRPIAHVARDLGIDSETLRKYVRRTEADEGKRKDLLSSQEREEIKQSAAPRGRAPAAGE
jgi:transposase-like protein